MKRSLCSTRVAVALFLIIEGAQASEETIGPKGINSIATGLSGLNSAIGQVEPGRPGKPGYDTVANCCNEDVDPFEVYAGVDQADVNEGLSEHALWVASVMISTQDTIGQPGGLSPPLGVAPQTLLVSAAFFVDQPPGNFNQDAALAAQALVHLSYATNMSFGVPADSVELDGTSTLSSFVDWSTVWQEVLYVVAGNEINKPDPVPTDNFNGITVAASARAADGVFRKVSGLNVYDEIVDAFGERTSTLILAPGELIDVAGPNGSQPFRKSGTSFAAPHVTGTLALLQQAATSDNANDHLTKKAVILNSADKVKGIIGMERTVLKYTSGPESEADDWFDTDAHSDPNIPVDREMGVGHLNAKRAVEQLNGGEHGLGGVPDIGWDFFFQYDPFIPNTYTLTLEKDDWVSATLVWDREVFLNSPFLDYQRGDEFIDFGFANLDLYLVPAGQGIGQAVASSTSTAWNLEHIFAKVPDAGNYELQVWTDDFNQVFYALAWWAGTDERAAPGDFNGDGSVNAADYVLWRKNDGSQAGYDEWRNNFGSMSGSGSFAGVPEPSTTLLLVFGVFLVGRKRRRSKENSGRLSVPLISPRVRPANS